ncbi:MAG: matrixin family metalloprotease [Silicimonas sp.]|nr:matrixin family metalloprotease [Silicimonas sp.]
MYNAGNVKWGETTLGEPSGTITWSADFVDDLNIASSFTDSQITSALGSAFNAWENVAAVDFQMVSSGADLNVLAGALGSGVAGTASYSYSGGGPIAEITSGEITFASGLTWSPYGGSGGVDFYAVALHEIGHILGLGHVNDVTEIMNPVVHADDLGDGDIDGVQYLYGTDAGDPPPNPPTPLPPTGGVTSGGDDGGGGGAGVGLLIGLIALLLGLFTGGGGAAVALAAGRVSDHDDDHDHDHDHDDPGHAPHANGELHEVYLPMIPVEEHDHANWSDEDGDEVWLF